ncbi:MAG: T9SS type A sorting domain-containing protein, partial [Candidatus Cloacimonetes bacterium]|nr:T9SS type A sorting domain-containing protein [Candidatus Cloacimonadota bacterium]MDY0172591.1 choice-of-anchor J domain-containing protein [Candidatus Cloacimonadaceae bacterium]
VNVNVNLQLAPAILEDSFEEYADFATEFGHWTLIDQDHSATFGIQDYTFPGSQDPMAFIIFNPSQTVPPLTSLEPYEGMKMAASFGAENPPNKDMMITRRINLGTNSSVKFYARSHTASYGLERFKVGVSTMPVILPQGFQYISGAADVLAPTVWTEYIYDLSAYDGQDVYIAIRCNSDNAFIFYVDNFSVHTEGGSDSQDITAPVLVTALKGNYPNPFNPTTTIRYSTKEAGPVALEIYNVKGQLVKKLVNEDKAPGEHTVIWNGTDLNNRPVSTGVYFYKMHAGKYSSTRKMIMMK